MMKAKKLIVELEEKRKREVGRLEDRNERLEARVHKRERETEDLRRELEELRREHDGLRRKYDELEQRYRRARNDFADREENMRKEIDDLKSRGSGRGGASQALALMDHDGYRDFDRHTEKLLRRMQRRDSRDRYDRRRDRSRSRRSDSSSRSRSGSRGRRRRHRDRSRSRRRRRRRRDYSDDESDSSRYDRRRRRKGRKDRGRSSRRRDDSDDDEDKNDVPAAAASAEPAAPVKPMMPGGLGGEIWHDMSDVQLNPPQGGGGGRGRACFRCFREGHMSADCPGDSDIPVTMVYEIPPERIGRIVGPKGATIKSIRDISKCNVKTPNRDEMVLNAKGLAELKIYAPDDKQETAQKAYDAIEQVMRGENLVSPSDYTASWECPSRSVARIIGSGGSSIQAIRNATGCEVHVPRKRDDGGFEPAMCTVTVQMKAPDIDETKVKEAISMVKHCVQGEFNPEDPFGDGRAVANSSLNMGASFGGDAFGAASDDDDSDNDSDESEAPKKKKKKKSKSKKKDKKKSKKKKDKKKSKKKKKAYDSSEAEDSDDASPADDSDAGDSSDDEPPKKKKGKKAKKKKLDSDSESGAGDSSDDEPPKKKKGKKVRKALDSDSDDESPPPRKAKKKAAKKRGGGGFSSDEAGDSDASAAAADSSDDSD